MKHLNTKTQFGFSILPFALCIFFILFSACDNGHGTSDEASSSDTGSIAFSLAWEEAASKSGVLQAAQFLSSDVCDDYGIETIRADVYNSSNEVVASKSWPCSDRQGTISDVPIGSDMRIVFEGTVSDIVLWRGETTGITVSAGETTQAETVTMNYIGDDTTAPTVDSTNPINGATDVSIYTAINATFSEKMVSASVNATTFTLETNGTQLDGFVKYDSSTLTATFTPNLALSFSTTYSVTTTTSVEDLAGNQMTNNYTWSFTTGLDTPTGWQKSDMGFTLVKQKDVVVGDGRNDGVLRVYSTTGEIHEYTFLTGHWEKSTFGDDFLVNSGIAIGDVRNDGESRVYVTDYSVYEYHYAIDSWSGGHVCNDTSIIDCGLILGAARNDGVVRIYIGERNGVQELSYNYGDWNLMEINSQPYARLAITNGRNDGVLRLYAAIDDHVYEYTWSGTAWQVEDCGTFDVPNRLSEISAGNGRNDGINRIYLTGDYGDLFELSYDGQSWQHIKIINSYYIDSVVVGNGRNDGINRVYTGSSMGIGEYTYGGTWVKTASIDSDLGVNGIAVGNGRNDGVNRVYVTGDDNHIYEYSFE